MMVCLVRQRPHLRRDGKQRLLRRVGVDGELVGAPLRVPLDVEPEEVEPFVEKFRGEWAGDSIPAEPGLVTC